MKRYACQCGAVYTTSPTPRLRCVCGLVIYDESVAVVNVPVPIQIDPLDCIHRSEGIDSVDCGCEGNTTIYACALHGRCMIRKLKPGLPEVAYCNVCEQRQPPA